MGHLKDFQSGTSSDPFTVGSSGSLTLSYGTINGVAYLNGAKVLTTGSALTFDGQTLTNTRDTPILVLNDTAASNVALRMLSTGGVTYIQSGISAGAFSPIAFTANGGSSEQMRLTSTGLGIGTSSPTQLLQVAKNQNAQTQILVSNSDTTNSSSRASISAVSGTVTSVLTSINGLGAYFGTNSNHGLNFVTNGNNAGYFDTSGNLGIGETSPSTFGKLVVKSGTINLVTDTATQRRLSFWSQGNGNSENAYIQVQNDGGTTNTGEIIFATKNVATTLAERARITAEGNLLVGLTSALGSQLGVQAAGGNGTSFTLRHTSATAGKFRLAGIDSSNNYLVYNNSNVGMYMTDGGTSWTATSDETQKILTSEFSNAATFLSTVRATRGRYKTDDESISRSFLIAQDWQEYLPEAISEKDGILGLSYQDTIPVLVKAIQELTARITALEGA
jgi:hypothetical protein